MAISSGLSWFHSMKVSHYSSFLDMLRGQNPSSPAIVYKEGEQKSVLDYATLIRKVEEFPIEKHGCVGIFADGSLTSILAILAYASAHIQIALLSPLEDPRVLMKQIQAADIDFLLGPKELTEGFSEVLSKNAPEGKGDILFFTSGTTSSNKAVVLTQESLCSSAFNGASLLPLSPNDVLYSCLPLSHVFGFVCSFLWPLSCGASLALSGGIKSFFTDFLFYRPTAVSLVPQMAGFLLAHRLLNPELGLILIGAGDCSESVLSALKAQGIRVSFGYGLTETSSGVALSLGEDPKAMTVCPKVKAKLGEDGEILLSCPTLVMKGYYKDEKATQETFSGAYLKTGDLGKIDENGLLHVIGRKKEMLVLSDGSKVFLPEFEAKLASFLGPGVDFAACLNKIGQVALCVGKAKLGDDYSQAILAFNQTCPYSHRIAQTQYFPNPLPRTQTGKIKRWQLPSLLVD